MKRAFTLAIGLGAGLLIGAYVVQRLQAAQRAVAPANIAGNAGRAAGGLTERVRAATEQGRQAARTRELELRDQFVVPGVRQVLGK